MTFEKRMFSIFTRRKVTDEKTGEATYENLVSAVEGYTFATQLPQSMETVEIGVYKRNAYNKTVKGMAAWVVTDLETGLIICEGDTRKKAVEKFLTVYASKYDRLRHDNYGKFYEIMVLDFNKLKGAWND